MFSYTGTVVRAALWIILLTCPLSYAVKPGAPYKYVDQSGTVHFTDRPKHDGYVQMVRTWKGWQEPARNNDYGYNLKTYRPLVKRVSERFKVPAALAHAVVQVESHYNPNAVSSVGAVGLMQLMPATARRYGVYNRHDPAKNVEAGVRYLRDLLIMFDNNIELVLAAYNAGENAVKRHGYRVPPYRETQHFVYKVSVKLAAAQAEQ